MGSHCIFFSGFAGAASWFEIELRAVHCLGGRLGPAGTTRGFALRIMAGSASTLLAAHPRDKRNSEYSPPAIGQQSALATRQRVHHVHR